jgi:hypothetical protein
MGLALQGSMTGIVDGPTCDPCHFTDRAKQTNQPPCEAGNNPYTAEGCLDAFYLRTYERSPHGFEPCTDCHELHVLNQSHETHTQTNPKGPDPLDCTYCHDGGGSDLSQCGDCHNIPQPILGNVGQMASSGACDNCHSAGGVFDGVSDVNVGAAPNWEAGIYDTGDVLKSGKDQWCVTCHDDVPASSNADGSGEAAPNIAGDNSTYGYYATGHGRASEYGLMCYQEGVGSGNPGANALCSECHNLGSDHIVAGGDVTRLKSGFENDDANTNCNQCHPPGESAVNPPELYTNSAEYEAAGHGSLKCTECHEVHGMGGAFPAMTEGGCRHCVSCHNGAGLQPYPAAPALPVIVPAHEVASADSCSSACHNVHIPAHGGGPVTFAGCFSEVCHGVNPMHAAHFDTVQGPGFPTDETGCDECHAAGTLQCAAAPLFWDSKLLDETQVCADCHIMATP